LHLLDALFYNKVYPGTLSAAPTITLRAGGWTTCLRGRLLPKPALPRRCSGSTAVVGGLNRQHPPANLLRRTMFISMHSAVLPPVSFSNLYAHTVSFLRVQRGSSCRWYASRGHSCAGAGRGVGSIRGAQLQTYAHASSALYYRVEPMPVRGAACTRTTTFTGLCGVAAA